MKRIVAKYAAVAAVAVAFVLGASAPGWSYVAVKGGMFMPNSDDKGLKDWDNGFGGELAIGGDFGAFAVDGGIGYFRLSHPDADDLNLSIVPLTITGKFLLKPSPKLTVYLGGGVGYYVGMLGGDDVEDMDTDDKTGKGVGFHAVGGLEIPLGAVGLLAEVKWSQAKVEFGESSEKSNIGGITALVGVKF